MFSMSSTSLSKKSAGSNVVELGKGKWWGRLLIPNTGPKKNTHATLEDIKDVGNRLLRFITFTLRGLRIIM